ncbi:glycoside hydrolase family 27 protein [Jonesia quinghaiensis]|uniref:glycoside hydrolase family 27 protein n=1 Tax=Jonesia quinghaiensis TaxID=262806 RepID=UPI00041DD6CE|nr:glycoside hydrolase family 27 protein [Jonesia quinghaiensis]
MGHARPPMGWNSWDCYGTTVTETELLANAQFMAQHLAEHGWDTVVCDIQWYEPNARAGGYNDNATLLLDANGRQLPVPERFPSALNAAGHNTGFTAIAKQIHQLGLRFGVHLMRGIPRQAVRDNLPIAGSTWHAADVANPASTCPWNSDNVGVNTEHPGAQDWYDALIDQLARWGVDFLKVDDMLAPYHARDIEMIHAAIKRAAAAHGTDITLSLSPGTRVSLRRQPHLAAHSTMWRISDDLWDRWEDLTAQLDRLALWAPHQTPGAWADADMLPLGRIGIRAERGEPRDSRLTHSEQQVLMSAWTLAQSPLMMGGDLPTSSPQTIELLTNADLLEHYRQGIAAHCILHEGDIRVWATPPQAKLCHVAVFNLADNSHTAVIDLADIPASPQATAVDIWSGETFTVNPGNEQHPYPHIVLELAPHSVVHLRLDTGDTDVNTV